MDQTKSSDLEEDNSSFFEFDSDWLSSFDDSHLIDPKLNELLVPNLALSISNKFSDVESVDEKIKSTTTKRRTRLDQRFLTCCQNEAHIFSRLKIQSSDILNEVDERFICHKCNKSRRFFCYRCFDTAPKLIGKIPHIRLPIKIDIIKHSKEVDGKSTSPHAAVIAPEDVTIYIYPNLPTNWPKNLEGVFLVFPKKGSLTVKRFLSDYYQISSLRSETDIAIKIDCDKIEENSSESIPYGDNHIYHSNRKKSFEWDRFPIKTLVFIDSTWRQTKSILHNEILQSEFFFLKKKITHIITNWKHS
ncbi:GPI transamidase component PIG-S-like [Sarcoptes scabiei]|nr:GPI transamidase component PIG-S-like [Sarcoptes scabiei]